MLLVALGVKQSRQMYRIKISGNGLKVWSKKSNLKYIEAMCDSSIHVLQEKLVPLLSICS